MVCRIRSAASQLISTWSLVAAAATMATLFLPGHAVAAPQRYSITNGKGAPSPVAAGQTVTIQADFRLTRSGTVGTYFEIRDPNNAIVTTKSYSSQSFASNEVRTYTWAVPVPSGWAA